MNEKFSNLEKENKKLEDDLSNIKDNHLTHINKDLSFVRGCLYFVTPSCVVIIKNHILGMKNNKLKLIKHNTLGC
ncbi:MAG: hypothetical protein LBB45_04325 [Methanobrevibacter sp.]|jgi:hypothetical protein|nr:hypothetical protein [Candidatus Methanovirga basalitermitum]